MADKTDTTTKLVAKNLGKTYNKRPVLRGMDVELHPGEAVGLLGPNGAGKTTCFSIICGLVTADFGEIWLNDIEVTHLPMYRRARLGLGYLPQESSVFRGLTVEQNIMAVLEIVEKNEEKQQEMLEKLLDEFGIAHLRASSSLSLSGGERRRLEIARALAASPQYLLLDEPLAGIDPIAMGEIRELIFHLKDRGIGVLITDHNVRETLDIVDRAYIVNGGKLLMQGTPKEIISHEDVRRVYLGERFTM